MLQTELDQLASAIDALITAYAPLKDRLDADEIGPELNQFEALVASYLEAPETVPHVLYTLQQFSVYVYSLHQRVPPMPPWPGRNARTVPAHL